MPAPAAPEDMRRGPAGRAGRIWRLANVCLVFVSPRRGAVSCWTAPLQVSPRGDVAKTQRTDVARAAGKFFWKNTMDLQWKIRANYNVRLCAGLRISAGARTIEKQ